MDKQEEGRLNLYVPITKVDQARREVWGWAAIEEPDGSNEIMDYQSSKPHFDTWTNQAQKRSNGKSKGNVREMHQARAAGKLIEMQPDDQTKGFFVGAQIVDEEAWQKVEAGVYTGFSIGGSYVRKWPDSSRPGLIRYTAKPAELSIVDTPCIPGAVFQMVKMASVIPVSFNPGNTGDMIKVVWEEDLEKVETPAPASMAIDEKEAVETPGPKMNDLSLDSMPMPQSTLEIKPNQEPSQTELMRAANLFQESLDEQVSALLREIPEMVKTVIRETLTAEMAKTQSTTSAPAERMIPVKKTLKGVK